MYVFGFAVMFLFLATVAAVFYGTMRMRRDDAAAAQHQATIGDSARESGETPTANSSARQKQLEDIRRRMQTGKCLHCESTATHASPRWRLVQPMLAPLYRHLGVVPIDHWIMETHVRSDADKSLCEWHHHESVAIMQERDGELSQEYTKLTREIRAKRLEFEQFALYEEMVVSRDSVHARGKRKKGARMASVTPINGNGTNGR